MTPDDYCQMKAAARGSSRYYTLLFLPPTRRRAVAALYAFCRELDEVVRDASDTQLASTTLAWWRAEVRNMYEGIPAHPVSNALAPILKARSIRAAQLLEIVDGFEMDLAQSRYLDFAGLERYCHRAAGVAELLAAGILGYENIRTQEYAKSLGIAIGLTNIIRDVGEDARHNRIYLPMDELKHHGVPASDILNAHESDGFYELMRHQSARASEYFARALNALPSEDRRAQRPGLIMARICRNLLAEIEHDGYRVLTRRTSLTPLCKFWIAWKTWVFA